ncbi:hypothetical protein ACXZ9C_11195 [Streptococcus agalactiae]
MVVVSRSRGVDVVVRVVESLRRGRSVVRRRRSSSLVVERWLSVAWRRGVERGVAVARVASRGVGLALRSITLVLASASALRVVASRACQVHFKFRRVMRSSWRRGVASRHGCNRSSVGASRGSVGGSRRARRASSRWRASSAWRGVVSWRRRRRSRLRSVAWRSSFV